MRWTWHRQQATDHVAMHRQMKTHLMMRRHGVRQPAKPDGAAAPGGHDAGGRHCRRGWRGPLRRIRQHLAAWHGPNRADAGAAERRDGRCASPASPMQKITAPLVTDAMQVGAASLRHWILQIISHLWVSVQYICVMPRAGARAREACAATWAFAPQHALQRPWRHLCVSFKRTWMMQRLP